MASNRTSPKGRPTKSRQDRRAGAQAAARRQGRLRVGLIIAGAVIVIGIGVVAFTAGRGGGTGVTEPEAWDLPALNSDDRVTLADFEGKPLVVNFFASWCTACDFELPHFSQISQEFQNEVVFVGVNALESGDKNDMPERHGITWWPLASDIGPNGGDLHASLGGRGMPITAFYDADGNLVDTALGAIDESTLRSQLQVLFGIA